MIDGSVSGGATNLITDGDAESGTVTNYIEGSYAAATRPAGTFTPSSGAGTFAISNSATAPLFGTRSFILTKSSGASRQGRAIERTITIDQGYQASVMDVFFQYEVVSGTFVAGSQTTDSSMIVYFAVSPNGTTWTIREPSSFKLLSNSSTIMDTMVGSIQTDADTTHVKVIMYVAETANSAWSLKCELGVRPTIYVYGTPITDWTSYTPTITHTSGAATNYTTTAYWRRVGDSIDINGVIAFSAGSSAFDNIIVSLPTGRVIDTTKISGVAIGNGTFTDAGSGFLPLDVVYNTTTNFVIYTINSSGTYSTDNNITNAIPVTIAASDGINFQIKGLPIVGQSSSVQVSESTDTRVVSFVGTGAGGAVTANVTNIPTTAVRDSHGGWSGSVYTIFVPGDYQVSGYIEGASASSLFWYKNGVSQNYVNSIYASALGSAFSYTLHNLVAGDQISFRSNVSQTLVVFRLAISRISGPAAIAASEKIRLRYSCSTSPSINNTTPTITYDTRRYDTHLAYVGNEFRPPRADFYTFRGSFQTISHATTLNFLTSLQIFVDGVLVSHLSSFVAGTVNACRRTAQGTASLFLTTDNVVTFRFYSDTSTTLSSFVEANWIEVEGG